MTFINYTWSLFIIPMINCTEQGFPNRSEEQFHSKNIYIKSKHKLLITRKKMRNYWNIIKVKIFSCAL